MVGFLRIHLIRQGEKPARLSKVERHALSIKGESTLLVYPEPIRLHRFAELLNTAERARRRLVKKISDRVVVCCTFSEPGGKGEIDVIVNEMEGRFIDRIGKNGTHFGILDSEGLRIKISDSLALDCGMWCDISIIMEKLGAPQKIGNEALASAKLVVAFPDEKPQPLDTSKNIVILPGNGAAPDALIFHSEDKSPGINCRRPFQFYVKNTVVEIIDQTYEGAMAGMRK